MSIEMVAWHSMYRAANDHQEQRPFSMATLRRIAAFARPHRRRLAAFLVVSVVGAVLAVAIPVLAGRVVDAIVNGGPLGAVVGLAVLIAAIAVAEAGVEIVQRWFSSTSGRASSSTCAPRCSTTCNASRSRSSPAPVPARSSAGSTTTSSVRSARSATRRPGVVGNVVTLALTLVVMPSLSWQVTLLALVLLPVLVLPARRMGRRLASMQREAADHNAAMGTQMTERSPRRAPR